MQLKDANSQLQLAHRALLSSQAALNVAREQGAALRAKCSNGASRRNTASGRTELAGAQSELGTVREYAAAEQARAETLEQHLKQ